MGAPCTVCKNPGVRKVVDGYLEESVSGAGISRALADLGLDLSADIIRTHSKHYAPPPVREKGTRKHDFAVTIRDRMANAIDQIRPLELDDGSLGPDPILDPRIAPSIGAGLKAQAIIDKREVADRKNTQADILIGLLAALKGGGRPVLQLEDGNTIEGTVVEVQ